MSRMYRILVFVIMLITSNIATAQQPTFEIKNGQFLYKGNAVQIHSGEMHYARVPQQYWRHRLKMMRAMGLNTVATYVFWNYHHPTPTTWDFSSGNHNIREFIKIAQEEGLFVILRPGPYACAEWEFGGYPWWLQQNKELVIRANNDAFLDSCKSYIGKLANEVKDLQASRGGPVIMVQVENEFGSYVDQRKDIQLDEHRAYNQKIYELLKQSGFDGPFFTSDGSWLFAGGSVHGVLPTANGEGDIANLRKAVNAYHNNEGPYMVAEYYPGWLDHWGEAFVRIKTKDVVAQLRKYLESGTHFNIYMAHGGTNFGFTSGANYTTEHPIQPDITSYDYDAPIDESGQITEKFLAIRKLMQEFNTTELPPIPEPIKVLSPMVIKADKSLSIFKTLSKPSFTNDQVLSYEAMNHDKPFAWYQRQFDNATTGILKVEGLRDYALVYVNGKFIGELNRMNKKFELPVNIPVNGKLELLVENLGRINYGADIVNNQKGIISPIYIDDKALVGNWKMFPLREFAEAGRIPLNKTAISQPTMYTFKFNLKETGDLFLDMSDWGKGFVLVNGHNIGKYWNIGPQQTLYVPGCWLSKGNNEIIVLDLLNTSLKTELRTMEKSVLEKLSKQTQ